MSEAFDLNRANPWVPPINGTDTEIASATPSDIPYDPRLHEDPERYLGTAYVGGEVATGSVAQVIPFKESTKPDPVMPERHTFTAHDVRKILESKNNETMFIDRAGHLLRYTFEVSSTIPTTGSFTDVPEGAATKVKDDQSAIEWLMRRGQSKRSPSKLEQLKKLLTSEGKSERKALLDATKGYENKYAWLDTALKIKKLMPYHQEPEVVELAIRQILLEAEDAAA